MAKEKPVKAPPPKPFEPPELFVGQTVYWHHGLASGEDAKPIMAKVTELCGNGRARLAVLSVDNSSFAVHDDPVPHKDDPAARRLIESDPDAGTWEECPFVLTPNEVVQLRALLADFRPNPAGERPIEQE